MWISFQELMMQQETVISGSNPIQVPKIVPVLSGGGSRLAAHLGVLAALEKLAVDFDHIVGVSGGSVIGALYASGYTINEIKKVGLETNFSKFAGQSFWSLLRTGGLSSGDYFESWVDEKLNHKTFNELVKDFHVVATDVRTGLPVIFNKETTPDMKVSEAVRYSMSIPLLFSFKSYKHHLMVDGSILSEEVVQRDWSGEGTPIVVFRLRSIKTADNSDVKQFFPLKSYLSMLIKTFLTTMSREYINDKFWHSTVVIDTGGVSPIDLKLNAKQKIGLFNTGYKTTIQILPLKLKISYKPD